jgi:hypothetical protein
VQSPNPLDGLNYADALHKLLNDPATHSILIERIVTDEQRDALDNVHNARLLLFMHELRLATLQALHGRTGALQ